MKFIQELRRLMSLDEPKRVYSVSGKAALRYWIRENMPELDAELGPLSMDQVRIRLNAITGCDVHSSHRVEDGSNLFLAALKDQLDRADTALRG